MSAPSLHRRGILAAALASAVVRGKCARADSPDPIHAAILAHERAEVAYCVACNGTDEVLAQRQGRHITQKDHDAYDAASDRTEDAMVALLSTVPTTLAGVHALLLYAANLDWEAERLEDAVRASLRSPAFG